MATSPYVRCERCGRAGVRTGPPDVIQTWEWRTSGVLTVTTAPHLNFRGDGRAALEFHQKPSGGDLAVITYADMGNVENPDEADQIVWGQVGDASGFHVGLSSAPRARPGRTASRGARPAG